MSPLSELVWSPDEGLSIKIAASSLSTRKASLRWNADTLSIVISSPQQSGAAAKSGDNVDANLGVSEKMPSQLQTRSGSSVRITMASPNNIANLGALQSMSMRSQEQDSRINVMDEGKEGSENYCVDEVDEVEANGCSTRCCKDISHSSGSKKEVMPSILENQVWSATSAHNERSWATNAWRARLLKAVSQNVSILPKQAEKTMPTSSSGDLRDAGSRKLAGFLCKRNVQYLGNDSKDVSHILEFRSHDRHQDQILQEGHKVEHVVKREVSGSGVNAVARCESASGINARRIDKGKEKVIYNNNNCVSNTKESDDSNESIESCPSMKAPKRKHVECSAANMSSRNKKCRREDNESACSGILEKCGSSFFNWMSSLTKGLITLDETTPAVPLDQTCVATKVEESAAPSLPLQSSSGIPVQSLGFNSLFRSLYNHNVMVTSRYICHQPERKTTEHVPSKITLDLKGRNSVLGKQIGMDRNVATGTLAADSPQMVSGASRGNFQNQFSNFLTREEKYLNLPNSCSRSVEEKRDECPAGCSNTVTGNKDGAKSLWVSRLLPKTSMKWMDVTPCDLESDVCAVKPIGVDNNLPCSSLPNLNVEKEVNDAQCFTGKGSSDGATSSKPPAMAPEESKQSGTMASVFAKRLDAFRHATTSAVQLAFTSDHGIHKRNNHRTGSFVISESSHDELDIRQDTHKSSSGNGKIVLWMGDKGKEQLCTGSNEESKGTFVSEHVHQHGGASTAGKSVSPHDILKTNPLGEDVDTKRAEMKEGTSDFMASPPNNKQIVPYGIASNDLVDESSVVCGALQRLRLSRSDIIRWLRSPIVHTSLDGFFVRLRFGKWEEALGGTGYHVARLNGALDRNRLSVTIRNSTCQVDSRFVSNHDFHEDELKAWWSAAMKGDWKLPSKRELDMKFRERELLHW
ncbi:hypothetical protein PR202_ga09475 [Eleusine coracana subsp. coracana]|uniref:Plus3 domain-containing protein n=1 Tax=Eleusine coracana subsp. coracana TaxID=191504 RepID=A0AAV5C3V3_ELECO|nr:hypothetical protein PR202_ga09475 [Eleusine coracana subsp. coracana]